MQGKIAQYLQQQVNRKLGKFEAKYQIIEDEKIGQGAQGSVFKAVRKDDPNGKIYAAKIYHAKDDAKEQTVFETEILMYSILPKTELFGKLVEYFDDDDRKILILDFIDGTLYKHHKEARPVGVSTLDTETILKYAIQMVNMVMTLENHDVYFADFHGENIMVKSTGDLVLTDFGASARISDRAGNINPKGFCAAQIIEKYLEKKQTPSEFKERLFNEHYTKQLLNHFKVLAKCVEEEDEFIVAFKELIAYMEKTHQEMMTQEQIEKEENLDEEVQLAFDQQELYDQYYSTMDTYGTYGQKFALKTDTRLQIAGPSMSEKILDKLKNIVFNKRDLLKMTFRDEAEYEQYYDSKFEKYF